MLPGLRGEVFVVGCLLLHPLPVDEVVETGGAVAAVLIVFLFQLQRYKKVNSGSSIFVCLRSVSSPASAPTILRFRAVGSSSCLWLRE